MATRARPGSRKGFTLIELMIAMVILAGGLLTMATVQIESMQGGQRGRISVTHP